MASLMVAKRGYTKRDKNLRGWELECVNRLEFKVSDYKRHFSEPQEFTSKQFYIQDLYGCKLNILYCNQTFEISFFRLYVK